MRSEARMFPVAGFRLGLHMAAAHRAFADTLLPLAHSDTFFQGGALLQQKVPTAVRVSGPDAGSAGRHQGHFLRRQAPLRWDRS